MLSSIANLPSFQSFDYDDACRRLINSGYVHFADGDWAQVFKSSQTSHVVRVTPYDPAYRVFAECCIKYSHPNLPEVSEIIPLKKHGYLVELPLYVSGELSKRQSFLDDLKACFEGGFSCNSQIVNLYRILSEGLDIGRRTIPYFAEIDWNIDNVMFLEKTPIVTDAFYQNGPVITEKLVKKEKVDLDEEALQEFLKIPFQRKNKACI